MKTRVDLIHKALRNLGVLPAGQNPGAEEFNQVAELVDPMIEDLIGRGVCFIEDVDAVEHKHFTALAHVLAGNALSDFGMQNDPALTARAVKAEQDLGEMDRNSVRYKHFRTMRSDYPGTRPGVDLSSTKEH